MKNALYTESFLLPLMQGYINAGFPSPAEDYIEKSLDLNEFMIRHPAATFLICVQGDSMQQAGIFSGDILVVDRAIKAKDKDIVLVILDGEFTVKRIRFKEGKIFLFAENNHYSPIAITEERDFQIWGVVTYAIHKTR